MDAAAAPAPSALPPTRRLEMSLDDCIKQSRAVAPPKPKLTPKVFVSKAKAVPAAPAAEASANAGKKRRRGKKEGDGDAPVQNGQPNGNGSQKGKGNNFQQNNQQQPQKKAKTNAQQNQNHGDGQPQPLSSKAGRELKAGREQKAQQQRPVGGYRVSVSNLNVGVTEEDIKELFGDVGELVSARLQRGPNGRSAGAASVCYVSMKDALEAVKRYNGVPLDDMPLKITLASSQEKVKAPAPRQPAPRQPAPTPTSAYADTRPGSNNNQSNGGGGKYRKKNKQYSNGGGHSD
jgi:RNA recognition motif-containing protein